MAEDDKINELEKRVRELELEKRVEKLEKGIHHKKLLVAITVIILVIVASLISISAIQSYNVSRAEHGAGAIGFMGNAEQAEITSTAYDSPIAVYVTVQNTGSATVTISSANIDGNAATVSGVANNAIPEGTTQTFTLTFAASGLTFTDTAQYTINLETAKGNTLTSTYTYSGQTSDQTSAEQASITNTAYNGDNSVLVTIQNTGSATVTITSATIDGNPATISVTGQTAPWTIAKGTSETLTLSFATGSGLTFTSTAQYTINLVTAKGNTITATYTYTGAPTA